jgi:hypothetical protein
MRGLSVLSLPLNKLNYLDQNYAKFSALDVCILK